MTKKIKLYIIEDVMARFSMLQKKIIARTNLNGLDLFSESCLLALGIEYEDVSDHMSTEQVREKHYIITRPSEKLVWERYKYIGLGSLGVVMSSAKSRNLIIHDTSLTHKSHVYRRAVTQHIASTVAPETPKVHKVIVTKDNAFIIMDKVHGKTLVELILSGKMSQTPYHDKLHYLLSVAKQLQKFHSKQLLHNDIQSGNLVIQNKKAVLIDFGCSQLVDSKSKLLQDLKEFGKLAFEIFIGFIDEEISELLKGECQHQMVLNLKKQAHPLPHNIPQLTDLLYKLTHADTESISIDEAVTQLSDLLIETL